MLLTLTIWFLFLKLLLNGKFAQRIPCTERSTTVLCPVNLQEPLTITMMNVANDEDGTAFPPITVHHPFVVWAPSTALRRFSSLQYYCKKSIKTVQLCNTSYYIIYNIIYIRHIKLWLYTASHVRIVVDYVNILYFVYF